MKVYVVDYSHRHGSDVCVYSTEEKAEEAAAKVIREYLHEMPDVDAATARVQAFLDAGKYADAVALFNEAWCEACGDIETIDITTHTVDP